MRISRRGFLAGASAGVLAALATPRSAGARGLLTVFLIENGAIARPVNNFRFNESPVHMLAKCDAPSAAVVTPEGNLRAPALRTHECNLASISEAV